MSTEHEHEHEHDESFPTANGWNEYKRLVLSELRRMNILIDGNGKASEQSIRRLGRRVGRLTTNLEKRVEKVEHHLTAIKVKASFYGAAVAAIVMVVMQVIASLINKSL